EVRAVGLDEIFEQVFPVGLIPGVLALVGRDPVQHVAFVTEQRVHRILVGRFDHRGPPSSRAHMWLTSPSMKSRTLSCRLRDSVTSYPQRLIRYGTPPRRRRPSRSPCPPCAPCRRPWPRPSSPRRRARRTTRSRP